jgi:putative endonuclease
MNIRSSETGNSRGRSDQGKEYENLAARFYEENGFDILEQNWRAGHKEIDLIVRRADLVVFVEVKSTCSRNFGHPVEKVDQKKIRNLSTAAQQYLIDKTVTGCDLRFDVVTFVNGQLEHFPGAFDVT